MEPAPPPRAPAAGPGASPRRFRSAWPSHGARAGRWGAPGSAPRPRTSQAPQASAGDAGARRRGNSLREAPLHPTDARDARAHGPGSARRTAAPQPRSGARLGRKRRAAAAQVAESAPPLAPAAAAAAPLRQPRRVPAAATAAASGCCPRPARSGTTGFPGSCRASPLCWGVALRSPPGILSPFAGIPPCSRRLRPLQPTPTSSLWQRTLWRGFLSFKRTRGPCGFGLVPK
jgi:hypothetical protein